MVILPEEACFGGDNPGPTWETEVVLRLRWPLELGKRPGRREKAEVKNKATGPALLAEASSLCCRPRLGKRVSGSQRRRTRERVVQARDSSGDNLTSGAVGHERWREFGM